MKSLICAVLLCAVSVSFAGFDEGLRLIKKVIMQLH
jgi:hypothetical protein